MDVRVLAVIALGLFGAAGCIVPELTECADGRACPAGLVCDDVHHGCVSPDQLAACHDAVDLTACHTALIPDGVCFGGICLMAGCGNAELEPGELCDDGNLVSGDGCSADCRSREVCGDGFADTTLGEVCDDGDRAGHDGCTATCLTEDVTWRRQGYAADARMDAGIVYDPIRRVVIVFGGLDFLLDDLADTWEWNGAQWRVITPVLSPPARHDPSLAYDAKRHRVVLFGGGIGGVGGFNALNDTWEFDGAAWQRMRPATSPPARHAGAMAWDPAIGKIVLFGGDNLTDTWTWDGVRWTRIDTAEAPSSRSRASLVYDAARDRLLLFGGTPDSGFSFLVDTWTFDGTTWTQVVTTGGPTSSVYTTAFVYDPIHAVPIGITDDAVVRIHVWELAGTTWRLLNAPSSGPNGLLSGKSWTFDIERGVIVEFGGNGGVASNTLFEYHYDVDWTVPPITAPGLRSNSALAYDPERARVVMCCGAGGTQEWDGIRWSAVVAGGPGLRTNQATAYDGVSKRVLVFGGSLVADTWAWDGTTWSDVTSTPSPSPRSFAAMAYDSVRHRVVLFGGLEAGNVARGDTWEWDGVAWQDVTVASSPPAMGSLFGPDVRGSPAMAFDRARGRVVLFGGAPTSETWEWDGVTWTQRGSPTIPGPFIHPAMVYDRAHERIVLVGGSSSSSAQWEWDGASWTQASTASIVPEPRSAVAAAYDEARSEIVRFGGSGSFTITDAMTWLGAYRGPDDEVCGSGVDVDRDGTIGCADDDCVAVCEHCGDGTCNGGENDRLCPADCPAAPAICGDAYCAPTETVATCAADCL